MVLCLAHGESKSFLEANVLPKDLPVIDLTADFRTQADFGERSFVYGLPEYHRNELRTAKSVANPGCFATAISLGLLPAVENGWLTQDVHISAITGATGAGQKLSASSHFPWRDNNISSYKVMTHQHLKEIRHQARFVQADFDQDLLFIPYRGNFSRGILATLYFKTDREIQEWVQLYQARYALHPFTHISSVEVNLKQVVNTNKALIHLQKHDDYLVITSVIDNLLKGAAGQAVQNLNLLFDLEETTGLTLKASAF
jgi:N-acetyl-gamma-glutamyl-phosphate reductase